MNYLDLSTCPSIDKLKLLFYLNNSESSKGYVNFINLKNGDNDYSNGYNHFRLHGNMGEICIDDEVEYGYIEDDLANYELDDITFYYDCPSYAGTEFNRIYGNIKLDLNSNGCDGSDLQVHHAKLKFESEYVDTFNYSSLNGVYSHYVSILDEEITVTPSWEQDGYFDFTPESDVINFTNYGNEEQIDFCLTPNGTKDDLEIIIITITLARPGSNAEYKIIYRNKGNTNLSGSFDFVYDNNLMDLVSVDVTPNTQVEGNFVWNYSDLLPFESREINLVFNLNTPTDVSFPLNGNDVLQFTATINPTDNDETPNDKTFSLDQIVVNSYDPNDKTLLEGEKIKPEMVGEYVHYAIRFENTGTTSAINVVVRDVININQFDISTLVQIDASHDFTTRILNGNEVEFIFENINLPFDDDNNDGYVTFKIKTLDTLVLGDTFENEAEIYFDFNAPIITEEFVTTIANEDDLNTKDFNNSKTKVLIYPNPVANVVNIKSIRNQRNSNSKRQRAVDKTD